MPQHLLEELIRSTGAIDEKDFQFAKDKAVIEQTDLMSTLIGLGFLSEAQAQRLRAMVEGVSFVDLQKHVVKPHDLSNIPEPISRNQELVCFGREENGKLHVACLNLDNIDELKKALPQLDIKPYLTDRTSLRNALRTYQRHLLETSGSQISSALKRMRNPEKFKGLEQELPERFHTEIAEDISSTKVLDGIIRQALYSGTTHIYLIPDQTQTRVNFRISGKQYEAINLDGEAMPGIVVRLRHLIDQNIARKDIQEGFATLSIDGTPLQIQVLFFETQHGTKAVLRMLRNSELFDSFDKLMFSKTQREFLHTRLPSATAVIVAGTPKSGVTRAYYALLEHLRNIHTEIVSIENPIEAPLNGITQISTYNKKNKARLLESVISTHPEVIGFSPFSFTEYVAAFGALRGSIKICFETGHLSGFVRDLVKNQLATRAVISRLSLAIVHARFDAVTTDEKKDYTLSGEDLLLLAPYFTFGELKSILAVEGLIESEKVKDISNVVFTVRKRETKSKTKKEAESVYVRGVFDIAAIIEGLEGPVQSTTVFENHMRRLEKKAIIENALIACAQGKVSFNDIKSYINE